ncbi:MAG TPA: ABC transporter permease subunit [Patescibacteria group bacterium]|nr:ABC transporter permease subunit [Patescibacteria group bacterium]
MLSQIGLDLGFLLGGMVIVERVFSWPAIGKLAVDSIVTADVPLILGTVLFGTLAIVLANLFVDVLQVLVDPRIRH